jgi:D-alanyl-lipoteichoic acid acyltransferase DltB (MBOAT superfamily)
MTVASVAGDTDFELTGHAVQLLSLHLCLPSDYLVASFAVHLLAVLAWLIGCSVAFYGIWNPLSLAIIAPSMAINYASRAGCSRDGSTVWRSCGVLILAAGVRSTSAFWVLQVKNFLDSVNSLSGSDWPLTATILPLGISFITFQKIASWWTWRRRDRSTP